MTDKQRVLAAVADMPESASVQQIAEEIEIMAAIRVAEEDIREGRTTPHEEVRGLLHSWISK